MQVIDHLLRPDRGDEAQIGAAGLGVHPGDPGVLVVVERAEVDLLAAELQRGAFLIAEILALHAEHALIPGRRYLDVAAVDDQVVEAVDGKAHHSIPS